MTLIITVNGSIKQNEESTPNLSILPKPLSLILDARALDFNDGDYASEMIASGTWGVQLRTFKNVMQDKAEKHPPVFLKNEGYFGNPCLRFSGENNIRSDTFETTSQKIAIATLSRVDHYNTAGRVAYLGNSATNRRGIQVGTAGVSAIFGSTAITSDLKPFEWVVQIAYFDGANSKLIVGDNVFEGGTSGSESFNCITMGGDNTGTTAFTGDISYLAVYEGELTTAQLLAWAKEIKLMLE